MSTTITTNIYGFITPTHTKKSTTRPDTYTKAAWDKATFDAYLGFVSVIERKTAPETYLTDHVALFNGCGMPADVDHLLSLTIAMAKDGTKDGEKVRNVLSITSFRQFFNGQWIERENRKVVYKAPKAPKPAAEKKPSAQSKKGPSRAELAAQNEALLKQIAVLQAALGIAA